MKLTVATAAIGLLISGAAGADPSLPTTLLPGTILPGSNTVTYGFRTVTCNISGIATAGASPSTFMRNGAGPATFTTTNIGYQAQHNQLRKNIYAQFYYSGAAVFNFTTTTSGTLTFDVAPVGTGEQPMSQYQTIHFKTYQQSYDTGTKVLQVGFVLELPSCPLTVTAMYHGD